MPLAAADLAPGLRGPWAPWPPPRPSGSPGGPGAAAPPGPPRRRPRCRPTSASPAGSTPWRRSGSASRGAAASTSSGSPRRSASTWSAITGVNALGPHHRRARRGAPGRRPIRASTSPRLRAFSEEADLVKFAKAPAAGQDCDAALAFARDLLARTAHPVGTPPAAPAPARPGRHAAESARRDPRRAFHLAEPLGPRSLLLAVPLAVAGAGRSAGAGPRGCATRAPPPSPPPPAARWPGSGGCRRRSWLAALALTAVGAGPAAGARAARPSRSRSRGSTSSSPSTSPPRCRPPTSSRRTASRVAKEVLTDFIGRRTQRPDRPGGLRRRRLHPGAAHPRLRHPPATWWSGSRSASSRTAPPSATPSPPRSTGSASRTPAARWSSSSPTATTTPARSRRCEAAGLAKALGVRVFPILVGTGGEVPYPVGKDLFGRTRSTSQRRFPVNPELLEEIAAHHRRPLRQRHRQGRAGARPAGRARPDGEEPHLRDQRPPRRVTELFPAPARAGLRAGRARPAARPDALEDLPVSPAAPLAFQVLGAPARLQDPRRPLAARSWWRRWRALAAWRLLGRRGAPAAGRRRPGARGSPRAPSLARPAARSGGALARPGAAGAGALAAAVRHPRRARQALRRRPGHRPRRLALDAGPRRAARPAEPRHCSRSASCSTQLAGDRVGLVVFAGEAFVQCPLTTDYAAARLFLRAVTPESVPQQGSDLGNALQAARQVLERLRPGGGRAKVVLLVSDGEDLEGEAGAAAAPARRGRRARSTPWRSATAAGEPIPVLDAGGEVTRLQEGPAGQPVVTRLDLRHPPRRSTGARRRRGLRARLARPRPGRLPGALDGLEKGELTSRLTVEYEDRFAYAACAGPAAAPPRARCCPRGAGRAPRDEEEAP